MLAVKSVLVASSGILVEPWPCTWLAQGLMPESMSSPRRQNAMAAINNTKRAGMLRVCWRKGGGRLEV